MVQTASPSARPLTLIQMARKALGEPAVRTSAKAALGLFQGYCTQPLPRIPGCDTGVRLAIRIDRGMSAEEAAAREYAYRWQLFLGAWTNHVESRSRSRFIHSAMCFPAPHILGQ